MNIHLVKKENIYVRFFWFDSHLESIIKSIILQSYRNTHKVIQNLFISIFSATNVGCVIIQQIIYIFSSDTKKLFICIWRSTSEACLFMFQVKNGILTWIWNLFSSIRKMTSVKYVIKLQIQQHYILKVFILKLMNFNGKYYWSRSKNKCSNCVFWSIKW